MVSKMFKWWIINDQEAIGYCALVLQFSFYSSYLIRYKLKLLNPGIQRAAWITRRLIPIGAVFFGFNGAGGVRYKFFNIQTLFHIEDFESLR